MQVVRMKAERRTALGRNQVARIRAEGWMPAVVYGEGKEPVSIAISEWELDQHVRAHHKVFQLEIGGAAQSALLQEVAWHATTDRPLHADFKRVDLTKPIETEIEVSLVGHPAGLSKGGVLMKDHLVLEIRCLPTAIPEAIEHDISGLNVGDSLEAGQITMPEGVTLLTPAHTSVCHVAVAVAAAEPAPAEGETPAAEGEAPAEGTPPEKE